MARRTSPNCRGRGKPSAYLGAASGMCPDCQNQNISELEKDLGMQEGELGRVDAQGNEIEEQA